MNEDVATKLKRYEDALKNIAGYVFPVYLKEDGKRYVPADNAVALRNWAKEALK